MELKLRYLALLGGAAMLSSCGDSAPEADELPYGTVQQMMVDEVQPTADIYWEAVRFESVLNDDGTVTENDIRPETDEDWQKLVDAADHMAELGEAMSDPAYANPRGEDWLAFSNGLVEASARAKQAALDKDADAVFVEGGNVYNVCRACHQAYPAENQPADPENPEAV